jgi:hypothetical protein
MNVSYPWRARIGRRLLDMYSDRLARLNNDELADYVDGDNNNENLGEFCDNPALLTELRNGAVVSPVFHHSIIRRGHLHHTTS